jgi:signal transduction histidine kinase
VTFQARLTIALVAIAALPLAILGYGVRREMTSRLDAEARRRVDDVSSALTARLASTVDADRQRLETLAQELANDNRFRIAIADTNSAERRWLLGWARDAMALSGFAVLQLQDASGRIFSSGHFRNDFDRVAPALPAAIHAAPQRAAVVDARTPEGSLRALVTTARFTARNEAFTITGGARLDSVHVARLSTDATVAALLTTDSVQVPGGAVAVATMPYVNDAEGATGVAAIHLLPDSGPLRALRADVARWLLLTLGATLLVAIAVAAILGRLVSAPIADLAERTARLDVDKLDQRFTTGRADELGTLEGKLDELTARLKASVARLRVAERAAATGDLARQINHDVKNGLAPIRNVLRHFSQVSEREPQMLAAIYAERRETLEASVEYLDQLARNYARLSPALGHARTDPRPVLLHVARAIDGAAVELRMDDVLPPVRAEAVVLHRIIDNLVSNAVDALEGNPGTITIAAHAVDAGPERRVRLAVSDTGRGMTRQELDRAFSDFFTTKVSGTGLGLSVVRRLVTDLGGSLRAETAPGEGSTFTVELPVAGSSSPTTST